MSSTYLQYHADPSPQSENLSHIPNDLKSKYGLGIDIPVTVYQNTLNMSVGEDATRKRIYNILTTPLGSKFRRPDFGSLLPQMVYNKINATFIAEVNIYVKEALEKWEPAIILNKVLVDTSEMDNNTVSIKVLYRFKGIHTEDNVVINLSLDPEVSPPGYFTFGGRGVFNV